MNIAKTIVSVKHTATRSAWSKGVKAYALSLLEDLQKNYNGRKIKTRKELKKALLNGASDWGHYSIDGNALIYDSDIAERVCNPSELKRKKNGALPPNNRKTWLDVQARALYQAYRLIIRNCGIK